MRRNRKLPVKGMTTRRLAFALSVVFICSASTAGAGDECSALLEQGCACAVPIEGPGPIAQLSEITGGVLVSGDDGFTPIEPIVPLNVNDNVILADDAQALLTAGLQCRRQLGPLTNLVIRPVDGCACAAVIEQQAAIDYTTTGQIGAVGAGAGLVLGGGAVGAVLLLKQLSP